MTDTCGVISVRRATIGDASALRAMRLEALERHPDSFGADFARELGREASWWEERLRDPERSAIFVSLDGEDVTPERLTGMAGVRKLDGEKLSHNGMIWGVYVDPTARGEGIGSELVAACLDWAREAHLRLVKLAVVTTNTAAIRCYERAGFRTYGIDPGVIRYEGLDRDELLMVCKVPRIP